MAACDKNDSGSGSDIHYEEGGDKLITFSMSLSGTNPFGIREIQTNKEKEVKRVDIYQFDAVGLLEAIYPDHLKVSVATGITVTIPVTSMSGVKDFVFVGNNMVSTPGEANLSSVLIGTTNKTTFLASVTKALTTSTRLATPLLMTGMVNGVDIDDASAITTDPTAPLVVNVILERVMSRIDFRNEETALTIESVQWINGNDKANLFGNTPVAGTAGNSNIITYPEITLPTLTATTTPNDPIHIIVNRDLGGNLENVKYEHVLYPYPAVKEAEPQLLLKGYYTLSDGVTTVDYIQTFDIKVPDLASPPAKEFLALQRNYCYTLVLKKTYTGVLSLTFITTPWTDEDDIDHPFVAASISVSYSGGSTATFDNSSYTLTVDEAAASYNLDVEANTEWEVYHYTDLTTISSDFSSIDIDASVVKSVISKPGDALKIDVKTVHVADKTYKLRLVSSTSPTTFKDVTVAVDVP